MGLLSEQGVLLKSGTAKTYIVRETRVGYTSDIFLASRTLDIGISDYCNTGDPVRFDSRVGLTLTTVATLAISSRCTFEGTIKSVA